MHGVTGRVSKMIILLFTSIKELYLFCINLPSKTSTLKYHGTNVILRGVVLALSVRSVLKLTQGDCLSS